MQSKDDEIRDLAIDVLGKAITQQSYGAKEKTYQAIFLQIVAKEKLEPEIVDALTKGLESQSSPESSALLLGTLGPRAKSAVPALVRAEL
jgi:hypothetical protein